MSQDKHVYSVTRGQVFTIVAALTVLAVSLPAGVMAATGSFVNIRDYSNTAATGYGRVVNNRIITAACDPTVTSVSSTTCTRVSGGKALVGDGSGPLSIDGSVTASTKSADSTIQILAPTTIDSTVNGGKIFFSTSAYRQVRVVVRVISGCGSVQGHAADQAAFILDAQQCSEFTSVYDVPPAQIEIDTTGSALVMAWGHR